MPRTGGWAYEAADSGGAAAARLAQALSAPGRGRTVVVYEPEGLAHESVDTPKVGRRVFGTLSKIRSEHPAVGSADLGWGIERPEGAATGANTTLLHCELAPGLIDIAHACTQAACRLTAAWSAYTVASAAAAKAGGRPRFALLLAPEFAAIASLVAGRRTFRTWKGSLSEHDWREVAAALAEPERRGPSLSEAGPARSGSILFCDGDPASFCSPWAEIRSVARVRTVCGIPELAAAAEDLAGSHPANLAQGFPRPRDLNGPLKAAAVGGLVLGAALGAAAGAIHHAGAVQQRARSVRISALEAQVGRLEANRADIAAIDAQIPSEEHRPSAPLHGCLTSLSRDLPEGIRLTLLSIQRSGEFQMGAVADHSLVDTERVRTVLERTGFALSGQGGLIFEAGSGVLRLRGRIGAIQP